jgi:hypothetical protein
VLYITPTTALLRHLRTALNSCFSDRAAEDQRRAMLAAVVMPEARERRE